VGVSATISQCFCYCLLLLPTGSSDSLLPTSYGLLMVLQPRFCRSEGFREAPEGGPP